MKFERYNHAEVSVGNFPKECVGVCASVPRGERPRESSVWDKFGDMATSTHRDISRRADQAVMGGGVANAAEVSANDGRHGLRGSALRAAPRVLCMIDGIDLGGGAERLLTILLPAMRDRGVDVDLVSLYPSSRSLLGVFHAKGIEPIMLDIEGPFTGPRVMRRLRKLTRDGGYDVLWSHLRFANMYARTVSATLPGVKCVATS